MKFLYFVKSLELKDLDKSDLLCIDCADITLRFVDAFNQLANLKFSEQSRVGFFLFIEAV